MNHREARALNRMRIYMRMFPRFRRLDTCACFHVSAACLQLTSCCTETSTYYVVGFQLFYLAGKGGRAIHAIDLQRASLHVSTPPLREICFFCGLT